MQPRLRLSVSILTKPPPFSAKQYLSSPSRTSPLKDTICTQQFPQLCIPQRAEAHAQRTLRAAETAQTHRHSRKHFHQIPPHRSPPFLPSCTMFNSSPCSILVPSHHPGGNSYPRPVDIQCAKASPVVVHVVREGWDGHLAPARYHSPQRTVRDTADGMER